MQTGARFNCEKVSEKIKDCKELTRRPPPPPKNANRQKVQGRVFAMNKKDVDASPSVIEGTLLICSNYANVLIDPGSTHSFVCTKFVCNLNVSLNIMPHILEISMPVGDTVSSDQVYKSCIVSIEGHELLVDLIVLDIQDFDAILD